MVRFMRFRAGWLSALLLACSGSRGAATQPVMSRPAKPQVVVTLVIDQFAAWIATERLPLLPPTGGFARLRREGTWFRSVRYQHAATDTAPGHSSLYTGVTPRESGIQANEVLDASGHRISILRDSHTHVVTFDGVAEGVASSIASLRVETLADRVRERVSGAVIVSVSLKDRGAIFGGGRRPDWVFWFDPANESFVTSTAFAQALPPWARSVGSTDAIRALRATPWTVLDEPWVRAHAASPDNQPGEGDLDGWGTTFPHDFTHARRPGGALRASPLGDKAVLAMAEAAVVNVRNPQRPMLLAISLSSNDYIGHLFGPDSWEAWDQLRQLDASLGAFFSRLDTLVGADGWSVVLSADHGIVQLPEMQAVANGRPWCNQSQPDAWERPCGSLSRLDPDEVARELQQAAVGALGAGQWVLGVADPYVYLTEAAQALPASQREVLLEALKVRVRQHPEVERVVDTTVVASQCDNGESVEALICRSVPPRSGAVLYVQTRAGAFFDAGYAPGRGTSHGSPYLFDRTVPMLVRAPGTYEAGRVVSEPVSFTRYRETAERLLGM
jgi:hypothetical protein